MKIIETPIFDSHQVALDLGYSEEEIEDFKKLGHVMNFWSRELEEGRVKNSDFPKIDNRKIQAFREYAQSITRKKLEFYRKNKRLLL